MSLPGSIERFSSYNFETLDKKKKNKWSFTELVRSI